MPLPFLLAGAAVAAGAIGVKKGLAAKKDFQKAKEIGERAEKQYCNATQMLDARRRKTAINLQRYARLKIDIFAHEFKFILEQLEQAHHPPEDINIEVLKNIVQNAIILSEDSELESKELTVLGAYGAAGMLAAASTGTAISTIVVTNATLAWLGGGTLASGGFGVIGGMFLLGGLIAGPALALGGFLMASRAENALEEAILYESNVNKAIQEIHSGGDKLESMIEAVLVQTITIDHVRETLGKEIAYFNTRQDEQQCDALFKNQILPRGTQLKNLLDIPILTDQGVLNPNIEKMRLEIKEKIKIIPTLDTPLLKKPDIDSV